MARLSQPRLVLTIVCAGVVLASLDLFIVNVALPRMAVDLHVRGDAVADLSWVLNAYAIVYASLLVLFGRLAESRRRENGFLLGVVIEHVREVNLRLRQIRHMLHTKIAITRACSSIPRCRKVSARLT